MPHSIRFHRAVTATLASLLTLCTALASAQDSPVYGRTRALDESHSQAERQAELMVSLSAEKLISLLQKETGLLLEVKRLWSERHSSRAEFWSPRS
jgi:hypothetical protein